MVYAPLYFSVAGTSWVVERRREPPHLMLASRTREDRLFLFFSGTTGEVRRGEIDESFPEDPSAELLASVWRNAEVLRAGTPGEMVSHTAMVIPRWRDAARLFWRAVRARCPHCGRGRPLRGWFHLKYVCPVCGIRLDRGEDEDYYLGGMFFNILLAELIFAVGLAVVVAVLWPNVPWDGIEYSLLGAMIVVPVVLYPISRLLWLALDLLLRPPDETEMAWHAAARATHPDD